MEEKNVFEQYAERFGVKIQKYHAHNGALNIGSVALVLNIKTGYIYTQFHIFFYDDLKQHPRG